jgi:carbon-monoxide dehydrogenase medium subunit
MYDFAYHRPASLAEAAKLLGSIDEAKLMSGGMTLIPTLKQRLARPAALIDLGAIKELAGIEITGDAVRIGALTTHADVAMSADVGRAIPALAHLAGEIGDPAVRARGTIGGSISNNDPTADYPAAALALGATIHSNERSIAADDFFTGMFETALRPTEILTGVSFPVPDKAAYVKFSNPASRYAIVGVFVAKTRSAVRVAVTGAGTSVFRQREMEAALTERWDPEAIAGISQPSDLLNTDLHASAEYRAHLVTALTRRAVAAAR